MATNNLTVTFTATSSYQWEFFQDNQELSWFAVQESMRKKVKHERYWLQTWLKIKVALWETQLGLSVTIDPDNDTNEQRVLIIDSVHHARRGSRHRPPLGEEILVRYDCRYLDKEAG